MSEFDAKRARAKRPCPMWVDALFRDTATFEADEFGAYVKLLFVMWSAPACALPDDDVRLARAAGVSTAKWKRRIGPLLRPLLTPCEDGLTQKRLRREARFVEEELAKQSAKARGRWQKARGQETESRCHSKSDKSCEGSGGDKQLKSIAKGHAAASAAGDPFPTTQQPTRVSTTTTVENTAPRAHAREAPDGGGGGPPGVDSTGGHGSSPPPPFADDIARAAELVPHVVAAAGVDLSKLPPHEHMRWAGSQPRDLVAMWVAETGLSDSQIIETVKEIADAKRDGPPSSLRYFTAALQRRAQRLRDGLPDAPAGADRARSAQDDRSRRVRLAAQRLAAARGG